jgi:hypothetical protein
MFPGTRAELAERVVIFTFEGAAAMTEVVVEKEKEVLACLFMQSMWWFSSAGSLVLCFYDGVVGQF